MFEENALTVEAWVESDSFRPETVQVLVARWALRADMDAFESCDAGGTNGLNARGFFGAVFDGRYVYFVPQYNGDERHGIVLRYDTHGPFQMPEPWSAYDAGQTDGLATRGYYGAVHAPPYVYFVPRTDGVDHHSRLLRYDTRGGFQDSESWAAHDAGNPVSYQSAAFDGRFIYFAPGYEADQGLSGKVLRFDTEGEFHDSASYVTYDAGRTSGLETRCYDGAIFDGRYVYFAPLDSIGQVLRYDTQGDFEDEKSWEARDCSRVSGLEMGQCVGAIFDGRYVYYVPYANQVVVRYDTAGAFKDDASWAACDVGNTAGLNTRGYDGAAFDGRYIYFIPFWEGEDSAVGFHARVLRLDTLRAFEDPASWSAADGGALTAPSNPGGFNGGAFDGRFIYFSPWRRDGGPSIVPHGCVLRYDTAGPNASFVLKYSECGHNGGLCAALPGPVFTVNTDRGTLSTRGQRPLRPGRHYLAGVYDGVRLDLFVDGACVDRVEGPGGRLVPGDEVSVGQFAGGAAKFGGTVESVRISGVARSEAWIQRVYEQMI